MNVNRFKILAPLSILVAFLAASASAGGLFIQNIYRDNTFVMTALRGNDIVTLFVAVPMLILALIFSLRGLIWAQLIWMGSLGYMLYNYAFYLYGAAFNLFFLAYVAIFALSIYGLIFGISGLNAQEISRRFNIKTPVRWISGYMLFFGLFLGGLWVVRAIGIMLTLGTLPVGQIPQDILKFGHPTAVVYATDLSLLIPALLVGAVLLWQSRAWGYVVSAVVLVKASTYGLVMLAMSAYSFYITGAGDDLMPCGRF
jgi:hypothetical protein